MTPIRFERPQDGPQIEDLLDRAFGPERHARPSYRLREGVEPVRTLCFVAEAEGRIVGTIRHWPVRLGATGSALLLGPIAVDPVRERQGIGRRLMRAGLYQAAAVGHQVVVAVGTPSFLVGSPAFLCRFGFAGAEGFGITLPGLDDPRKLFARELVPGALDGAGGAIARFSPEPGESPP
ncbi:MAG: N-acetyltransferase [Rhodospirillales bacterium]|nr:N-acetyltransferase [Rhodospirillales bacterium]MDE0381767.1 N-acetyltransferase [Rhodospirillales bacterium]